MQDEAVYSGTNQADLLTMQQNMDDSVDPTAMINKRGDSPDMHEKMAERNANSASKRRQMQAAAP